MPSFEIPDGPTTLVLKTEAGFHKGTAVFNVTNKTGEGLTARFGIQVQGGGKAEWYSVEGEPERPVAAGETQTVTVVAKIPAGSPDDRPAAPAKPSTNPPAKAPAALAPVAPAAPAGTHQIKLRAINVNDPDNDSTDSAALTVTVPAAPKPAARKPFPWWILAVVGGVLVVVIGVIIAVVVMTGGSKVPKVVGLDYPAAVAALQAKGYVALPEVDEPAPDQLLGKVFKQEPEAGKKADPKTTQVKLTVAAAATVAVPGVTGLDYPSAVAALEKAGFKAGPAINEIAQEKGLGLVFKQDPDANAQADPKTTEVKLTVAIGETVTVPNVAGKPYVAAQALLEDRGFTVAPRVSGQASGQQPDAVLLQDPVGEATAPKGSMVTLTVDPGVAVPDLLKPAIDGFAGIKTLQNAGLDIGPISSNCRGALNMITAQGVDPKTQVAKGTKVGITVGTSSGKANMISCFSLPVSLTTAASQARAVNATAFKPSAVSASGATKAKVP